MQLTTQLTKADVVALLGGLSMPKSNVKIEEVQEWWVLY